MPKKASKKAAAKKPRAAKKESLSRPKGTRDIIDEDFYRYQGFFEKAAEVAIYYGFIPIHTPAVEKEEIFTSGIGSETDIVAKEMYSLKTGRSANLVLRPEATAAIMRAYIQNGMHTMPQPVSLYYYGPFYRHEKPQRGRYREFFQFGFETLGTEKSIADALIIHVTLTALNEMGLENNCVLINSIGDKTCRPGYIKELVAHYRKHLSGVCDDCRQRLKTNPLRVLDCKSEKCQPVKEEAPEMVGHLCNPCKQHFKEVLEYLDTLAVPYTIDHTLVRGIDYYTRTVFEVVNEEDVEVFTCGPETGTSAEGTEHTEDKPDGIESGASGDGVAPAGGLTLAGGGRYDDLSKQLGSRRDIPAVGSAIGVDRVIASAHFKPHMPRVTKKPKIYFVQIGYDAKLKGLGIIEILRKSHTPIVHALGRDKLSTQLGQAEKLGIPYVLIIGQREALNDTVIIRDMTSRSQNTVKIEGLAEYIKKNLK